MPLYLCTHPLGLRIFTRLDPKERDVIGDVGDLLLPGEEFGGLSYEQLARYAATDGKVDSDDLRTD